MSKARLKNADFVDQFNAQFNEEPRSQQGDATEEAPSESKPGESNEKNAENFAQLLNESFKKSSKKLSVGDKIKGKILVLGREDVYVSTGAQHDGVIARKDLNDSEPGRTFQVGDELELYVTLVKGTEIRLSRKISDKHLAGELEDAYDMMMPIQGRIVEVCKGGVRVSIRGKLAFCPISQIDIKRVENPEEYVGKSFEFRITQFSEGGRNIVVSRRKLLEEDRELHSASFLDEHKDGDIVEGKVMRLEKFGAFVELSPGLDGLVHISEIAWSRIGDPAEVLSVGQSVTVKILKRETVNDRAKISLSIKQAGEPDDQLQAGGSSGKAPSSEGSESTGSPDPKDTWAKYSVGQIVAGKVNRKEAYGLFVQLEPGITGLLHQSRAADAPDFKYEKFRVGDAITVQIAEIKKGERRISLDVPKDPEEGEWRKHRQETGSFGTLADQFKLAMTKGKK